MLEGWESTKLDGTEKKSKYVPCGTGLVELQGKASVFGLKELQKSVPATVTQNWLSWIVNPHPTAWPGSPDTAPLPGFSVRTVLALPAETNIPASKTVWEIRFMLGQNCNLHHTRKSSHCTMGTGCIWEPMP
jgi:hypothetical protein